MAGGLLPGRCRGMFWVGLTRAAMRVSKRRPPPHLRFRQLLDSAKPNTGRHQGARAAHGVL